MGKFNLKEDITWRDILIRLALSVATVAVIIWAMPRDSRSYFHVEQGKPWKYSAFTAPFDFPIYKSESAIQREKDSLMRLYEPYYSFNKETEGEQVRRFVSDYSNGIPGLPDDYISIIANRLHRLYQQGIINPAEYNKLRTDTSRMIRIVSGKSAASVQITKVLSTKGAYEQLYLDDALAAHRQILQKCNLND